MYTVTIRNQERDRVRWRVFQHRHEATAWLILSGFVTDDWQNPYTGEYAELQRRTIC